MKKIILVALATFLGHLLLCAQGKESSYGAFSFEQQVTVPGNPVFIYDNLTGDIKPWWDHSFSDDPLKLYIEPKPGGGFYEIFDNEGNGVRHATIIYADRGNMLRFEGPLGFSGMAINLVCTYSLEEKVPDSTVLTLTVHAAGEVPEGVPALVESVWEHFLSERFKPYIESKK